MGPPPGKKRRKVEQLSRFDGIERLAHWLTASFFLALISTGAALYIPAVIGFVGRRGLVERIHVDVGLALPLPLIVSLAGSMGQGPSRRPPPDKPLDPGRPPVVEAHRSSPTNR